MNNYTVFHCHSDLSNGVTNVDSVTKYKEYIDYATSLGMTAFGFSEHGSVFEWYHKKEYIESKGMKYIHGAEFYITETLNEKIRDNYHCVLIARNFEGFKELNTLVSKSFNRSDTIVTEGGERFYYNPRITYDELINTSKNIIVCTACIGGILRKADNELKNKFINFLYQNKDRCFLEIQPHTDSQNAQKEYNTFLYLLHLKYNIPLIVGTDTHALNEDHIKGRSILQKSKNVNFDDEEGWELSFQTYGSLVKKFKQQNSMPMSFIYEALENTNKMADMVESFELDKSTKYPKIYDNPLKTFKEKIAKAYNKHPYLRQRYSKESIAKTFNEEIAVYDKVETIDFMLLQTYMREWEESQGIQCGYGRGSVSGSEVAYALGITQMDSLKFDLNFFRFMNPERNSNADIDTDYGSADRVKVKEFLLKDHMNLDNIRSAEIITFNTIALKGAIRDVGRALDMPLDLVSSICEASEDENNLDRLKEEYPELFEYVDIVNGTIVSIGTHPSGVLISDLNIVENIGLCSISSSKYPVTMLNMKELDDLFYVKLDILGLDNIAVINDTCKMLDIERLTPDNTDLNDEKVWESIRDDTTLIFQWESDSASAYLRRFMSDSTIEKVKNRIPDFSYIKWFSFGNGLIRPACADYRDSVAEGNFYDNGLKELDEFLAPTMGYVTMQEDIMRFLVKFCGYSNGMSDTVRRSIAKKYGTEQLLPEIRSRFIEYTSSHYNVSKEKCEQIIEPFLKTILNASSYAFSWNHSDSYSCIGYICGYLRYYHPLEFLTASLNVFSGDMEKSTAIINYAKKVNITLHNIQFGKSTAHYNMDKQTNTIYKGIASIKYCNVQIADELFELGKNKYNSFMELLPDIRSKTSINERQLKILTCLGFFSEFGKNKYLLDMISLHNKFAECKVISKNKLNTLGLTEEIIKKYSNKETPAQYREIDNDGLINELSKSIENKSLSIKEQIASELEYLEYINYINPAAPEGMYYVADLTLYKDKSKPYLSLYDIKTGDTLKTKITKGRKYAENPFVKGNVLQVINTDERLKTKMINGKWIRTNEYETILEDWIVY